MLLLMPQKQGVIAINIIDFALLHKGKNGGYPVLNDRSTRCV
jgi:hypothetical protein